MTNSILIVEDDLLVRESLFEILSLEGYDVSMAQDGREGLRQLGNGSFDIALVDLKLPEIDGMDFLRECRERFPYMDVVMMTGYGTIENAVEAMKQGAYEYLTKPILDDEIKLLIRRIFETRRLRKENEDLKQELFERKSHFHNLVGSELQMQRIYGIIQAIHDTIRRSS